MRQRWLAGFALAALLSPPAGCLGEDAQGVLVSSGRSGRAAPEVAWMASFGGSGEESHGHFILALEDGGFLQVGETGFIPDSARLFVVKVNAEGKLQWKQEFGSRGHNLGNSALETGGGYVVVGALGEDSAIMELDKATGEPLWARTHDYGGSDAIEHLVQVPGGFAAVGYTAAEDDENTFFTEGRGHLMLLGPRGERVSDRSLAAHMAQAYRIAEHGGALFISGLTDGAEDYALLKASPTGEVEWAKTFGGAAPDHNFAFGVASDGSMFLSGHTLSGTENWDTFTVKVDGEGEVLWAATRGNPRGFDPEFIHDEAWGLRAMEGGGVAVVAGTGDEYRGYSECEGEECSDAWRVYVLMFDGNGTLEWEATYGPAEGGDWAGEDICVTDEGDLVVAVDSGEFGFLKLDVANME